MQIVAYKPKISYGYGFFWAAGRRARSRITVRTAGRWAPGPRPALHGLARRAALSGHTEAHPAGSPGAGRGRRRQALCQGPGRNSGSAGRSGSGRRRHSG